MRHRQPRRSRRGRPPREFARRIRRERVEVSLVRGGSAPLLGGLPEWGEIASSRQGSAKNDTVVIYETPFPFSRRALSPMASRRVSGVSSVSRGDGEAATRTESIVGRERVTGSQAKSRGSLDANTIIANAPDPVFVSDLEGRILQANDAVSELLGFRPDELLEQSLSRFISPEETREFMAALDEVVERGETRNAVLHPRSASGEVIPTTLNASALRDPYGRVIGAIGILRDMREYEQVVRDLEKSKSELQEKILDLEKFEEVVVGRELKMIALEKELESLRKVVERLKAGRI